MKVKKFVFAKSEEKSSLTDEIDAQHAEKFMDRLDEHGILCPFLYEYVWSPYCCSGFVIDVCNRYIPVDKIIMLYMHEVKDNQFYVSLRYGNAPEYLETQLCDKIHNREDAEILLRVIVQIISKDR